MKEFVNDILWTDEVKEGTINIGFTQAFIQRCMAECFHVIQADTKKIEKDGPLFVIETNDGLESIKSPVGGSVHYFNTKALNFPDKLTEGDVIATIGKAPPVKKSVEYVPFDAWQNMAPDQIPFQELFNGPRR